jgi:hypothetical protein
LLEDSYFSRFFAKFVEIVAISFATACSAYLVAHFLGPPPITRSTPAAVVVGSAAAVAVETPKSPPAQPAAPTAAAPAVDEHRPATRPVADAPAAQSAPKAAKSAASAPQTPVPKDSKTDAKTDIRTSTTVARSDKSAEALARAALANLDADRSVPADASVRRAPTSAGPVVSAPDVDVAPRPVDPPPRAADLPPSPAAAEAAPRHAATVDPLPPNAGLPPELSAPRAETPVEEARGLFALPKRVLGLLRPGTPSLADGAPRPPLPVGEERPD